MCSLGVFIYVTSYYRLETGGRIIKKVVYAFTTYLTGTKLYKNVFNYELLLPLCLNKLR